MANVALERTAAVTAHARPRRPLPPLWSWFYLLPAVLFFLGWQLLPILRVAWFSFTDFRFVAPAGTPVNWVGFDNYRRALDNPLVRAPIDVSLRWLVGAAGTQLVLGLLLLAVLARRRRWGEEVAAALRLPIVVPPLAVAAAWLLFYDLHLFGRNLSLNDRLGLGVGQPDGTPLALLAALVLAEVALALAVAWRTLLPGTFGAVMASPKALPVVAPLLLVVAAALVDLDLSLSGLFDRAIGDPLLRDGLARAFMFTSLFVPGMIVFPLIIAVMIDRIRNNKVATFYRLVLLIPSMIPGPLIFVLWKWMYEPSWIGPINWFLVDFAGLFGYANEPQWLGDKGLVFYSIAIMEWWWGLGYHTMFFLAGLATIPRDLVDAARVDGANEWRLLWNVTVPRLLPIILVLVVLRFGTAMAVLDEYMIIGGGFDRTRPTYTWTMYMWQEAFQTSEMVRSYAATIGWIGAFMMLVVVAGLFYVFRSRD
jgi:multiple sugar transport system permease protein